MSYCQTLRVTRRKARKDYYCDCSDMVREDFIETNLPYSFSEKRALVNARKDEFKIKKGTYYNEYAIKCENSVNTWRARLDMDEIYTKRKIWENFDY